MEENKNNTQKQPEQKKKKKSDVLLTIALIVAIAVFCYAAFNLYHIYTEYKKGTETLIYGVQCFAEREVFL